MKVLFFTKDEKDRVSFEADVSNLLQLLDYCKANKPELYNKLLKEGLSYTVYKEGDEQAYPIRKEMIASDISEYGILVVSEKMEGGVSAIAGYVIAALGYAAATAPVWVTAVAYAAAIIIVVGLTIALGYIIQALMPNKKLGRDGNEDPSESSRIFNGVPNITEQGGSVPVVIGNCLFGGVRIGLKFEPTANVYTDVVTVANFTAAMNYPSTWLKIA